jgi:hypothetical protein
MRIDRRLVLLGIVIIVLSMTMATQYATTKVAYSFAIVHPSDADIRFIGSDNSSGDSFRVLRVNNNNSGTQFVTIELGSWMPNSEKNYTAAFGIVNEETQKVNITYVNVSGVNASYLNIWLHGDRSTDAGSEGGAVKVVSSGASVYNANSVAWTLGAGDSNPNTMNLSDLTTPWDETSHVRYSIDDTKNAVNESSDFVWIQISLNIESTAPLQAATGTIEFHFKASTTG